MEIMISMKEEWFRINKRIEISPRAIQANFKVGVEIYMLQVAYGLSRRQEQRKLISSYEKIETVFLLAGLSARVRGEKIRGVSGEYWVAEMIENGGCISMQMHIELVVCKIQERYSRKDTDKGCKDLKSLQLPR